MKNGICQCKSINLKISIKFLLNNIFRYQHYLALGIESFGFYIPLIILGQMTYVTLFIALFLNNFIKNIKKHIIEKDSAISPTLHQMYKKFKNIWISMASSLQSKTEKIQPHTQTPSIAMNHFANKKTKKVLPEMPQLKKLPTTKERTPIKRLASLKNHFKSFSNLKKKRDIIFHQSNRNLIPTNKKGLSRNETIISSQHISIKNLDFDKKKDLEREYITGVIQGFSYLTLKNINFQNFMILITGFSLFLFIFNTPITDPNSLDSYVCGIFEIIFIGFYFFEFLVTVKAIGLKHILSFYFTKSFYNFFNLVNIVVSIGSLIENKYESRVFETMKVVRIFRLVSTGNLLFKHINLITSSLVNSLHNIMKLLFFFVVFIYIFSLFAMKFLKGMMFRCVNAEVFPNFINDKYDCMDYGGDWIKNDFHYDNILISFFTLFCVSSSEAWTLLMFFIFIILNHLILIIKV